MAASIAAAGTRQHPSLPDPARAKCAVCHGELLNQRVRHPPAVEDCRTCHEFSKKDGQLQVGLSETPPQLCLTCHDAQSQAAEGSLAAPHAPVMDSCTNCHSPHSAAEARLLKAPAKDLCLSCHAAADVNNVHPVPASRASCVECHAPHGSAVKGMLASARQHPPFAERACASCHRRGVGSRTRTKASGAVLCYSCHADLEARFATGSVHGAVREGRCTGCHDPHLGREPKLLRSKGEQLCFSCHAEIRAKVSSPGAHPPATESCDSCHDPHRSPIRAQLVDAVPALCLNCHDATDKDLVARHLGAGLATVNCVRCHDPHGSPQKGLLLAGSLHPPFAEKSCASCHEGSAGKVVEDGGKALCYACHSEVEETVQKAKVPHGALDVAECTDCHTPHASRQARLVKQPGGEVCTACHDDKAPGPGESAHGVVAAIGCQACHEPHGGSNPKLLRAAGSALCLGCHGAGALEIAEGAGPVKLLGRFEVPAELARAIPVLALAPDGEHNHPITRHRVLGKPTEAELARAATTFKGELECLTCHDPHKGLTRALPRTISPGSPLTCATCHPK